MKFLIVEDEIVVALDLSEILQNHFQAKVEIASEYDQVMKILEEGRIDIILMDIYINGIYDGIETAQVIKKRRNIPVIFITAYNDRKTLLRALRIEPENYIVKPFKESDVITAIEMVLLKKEKSRVVFNDEFFYDLEQRELFRGIERIKLTRQERRLLELLIAKKNGLVKNEEIDYIVWPEENVTENARRNLIYRLRKKLGYRFITTYYGEGCKLEIP